MSFDPQLSRVLWLWQHYNQIGGAPWFYRMYACAVEPVTLLPKAHPRSGELEPIIIGPEESLSTRLGAFIFTDPKALDL